MASRTDFPSNGTDFIGDRTNLTLIRTNYIYSDGLGATVFPFIYMKKSRPRGAASVLFLLFVDFTIIKRLAFRLRIRLIFGRCFLRAVAGFLLFRRRWSDRRL